MLNQSFNFLKCKVINTHIVNAFSNDKQLYHLTISFRNCLYIRLNDRKVLKKNNYIVGTYNNSNKIKIEIIGLLNKRILFLEISPRVLNTAIPKFTYDKPSFILVDKNFSINVKSLKNKIGLIGSAINEKNLSKVNPLGLKKANNLHLVNNQYQLNKLQHE